MISKKYTLDNFIRKSSNESAFLATLSVIQEPKKYNPLFLYGGVGAGKTHLLRSVTQEFEWIHQKIVLYATAQRFLNDFIFSLRKAQKGRFDKKYRNNHLLAIDDLHLIAGKYRTQQELLITLKELELKDYRVILASNSHPDTIKTLDNDLKDYCRGGLMLEIAG